MKSNGTYLNIHQMTAVISSYDPNECFVTILY